MLGGEGKLQHDLSPTDQTFCPRIVAKMWRRGVLNTHTPTHVVLQKIALSYCCNRCIAMQPCLVAQRTNSSNWGSKIENLKWEIDTLHLNFDPILVQEKMFSFTVMPGQQGC